jgi:hypothetical protein
MARARGSLFAPKQERVMIFANSAWTGDKSPPREAASLLQQSL